MYFLSEKIKSIEKGISRTSFFRTVCCAILIIFSATPTVFSQQSNLNCNQNTFLTLDRFPNWHATGSVDGYDKTTIHVNQEGLLSESQFGSQLDLISNRWGSVCLSTIPAYGEITLRDSLNHYNLSNQVGFIISNPADVDAILIEILNGAEILDSTSDFDIRPYGPGRYEISYQTKGTETFNGIRIRINLFPPAPWRAV